MNQQIRMVLAVALSVLVIVLYQIFLAPPLPQKPATKPALEKETSQQVQKNQEQVRPQEEAPVEEKSSFQAERKKIQIATDKSLVTIDTQGGVLSSYQLKKYHREADKNSPLKDLFKETEKSYGLFLGLKDYPALKPSSVFQIESDDVTETGRRISLLWQNKDLRLRKIIEVGLQKSEYGIQQSYEVENLSDHQIVITPYTAYSITQKPTQKSEGVLSFLQPDQSDYFQPLYFQNDKIVMEPTWQNLNQHQELGNISWLGVADRYFLMATAGKEMQNTAINLQKDNHTLKAQIFTPEIKLLPKNTASGEFINYIGPKEVDELSKFTVPFKKAVDYGWFDFVALPILYFMSFLHQFIPNWGLVIIVLTFIVKLLLHPVNKKSLTSMKAMQKLQPKMQEIRKKFSDDKQRQNEEVMKLFRTHKVNPVGGCLPMLLQMPIYIALYKVLWNSIEIYHAPFLFYKDLSAPDPYLISPILLGVFMFLQQKLTPSASTDPAQQKMMMIMPIMFTVFMLFLPVGLVIYIFVNTVMSVIQQYMMHRDISFRDLFSGKWKTKNA